MARVFTAGLALVQGAFALKTATLEGYTFEQFVTGFGRAYVKGSSEYEDRAALFVNSLAEVRVTNARNVREGRPWRAGIHKFMDRTRAELRVLGGYKPSRAHGQRLSAVSLLDARERIHTRLNATAFDSYEVPGAPLRDQGDCGSCWAISAVEAVEAQLQRLGAPAEVRLSPQALVSCVPNPQHCGGSGGCDGATGELAYAFMRDHGIPVESDLPYQAVTGSCPSYLMDGNWPAQRRAVVSGWAQLPSNRAEPLMRAIVEKGPVVVAVDGDKWFNYDSGVFDGCDRDAVLSHAVLARGYGVDTGNKYWLIQNSWGKDWGEHGHIRLLRHDDDDSWCGTDRKPKEGVGCDGGPSEVTVCGTCGLLYDPVVPEGVRMEEAPTIA